MYYIKNCFGEIVGNKKGYKTMRSATIAFNRRSTGIQAHIDDTYYERKHWYELSMMPMPMRRYNWYSIALDQNHTNKG
jgi:hypothetical protein